MDALVYPRKGSSVKRVTARMNAIDAHSGGFGAGYITDIRARRDLFLQLAKFQHDEDIQLGLNAVGFAIIMVAPIDKLRHLINILATDDSPMCAIMAAGIFGRMHIDAVLGIKAFIRGGGRCHRPGSPILCLEKHRHICRGCNVPHYESCPITGTEDVSATRIIPAIEKEYVDHIGSMIHMFWDRDTAKFWTRLSTDEALRKTFPNRLYISNELHFWMTRARLALKPLTQLDDGSIIVQLFWLKKSRVKPQNFFIKSYDPLSFEKALKRTGLANSQTWDRPLGFRGLLSGQMFTVKGDMDEGRRVPSFEHLQLLWDLTRVAAICGAIHCPGDFLDEDAVLDYLTLRGDGSQDDEDYEGAEEEEEEIEYWEKKKKDKRRLRKQDKKKKKENKKKRRGKRRR
ncbi:hypothetical protein V8C42DRAFT_360642 [Trichoderma barbatum]